MNSQRQDSSLLKGFLLGAAAVAALWLVAYIVGRPHQHVAARTTYQEVGLALGDSYWQPCSYIEVHTLADDFIIARQVPSGNSVESLLTTADVSSGAVIQGDLTGFGQRVVHDAGDNEDITIDVVAHYPRYRGALNRMQTLGCFR